MSAYNSERASHLVAHLLLRAPDRTLSVRKATSILYLALRRHLRDWGIMLLDEPLVASEAGIHGLFTRRHLEADCQETRCPWKALPLARSDGHIRLAEAVAPEALDMLSDADARSLDRTWNEFGHLSEADLAAHVRGLPEWRIPAGNRYPVGLHRLVGTLASEPSSAALMDDIRMMREVERRMALAR